MPARGRRRTARRPSRSALALRWIGILVLLAVALAYVQPLRSYRDAQAEVAAGRAEVAGLERANAALEKRIEEAGTPEFVVREARRLGFVKPGERLFIVSGIDEWKQEAQRR
jgi:cell division protein FtsB